MKIKILMGLVAAVLSLSACKNQPVNESASSRNPSNSEDVFDMFAKMDVTYREIISSANPEERFSSLFEKLVMVYFQNASLIRDFDQNLKNLKPEDKTIDEQGMPSYMQSEGYAKIYAAQSVYMRARLSLMYFYSRLNDERDYAIEMAKSKPDASTEAMQYSRIRKAIHNTMRKLAETEAVFVIEEIVQEFYDYHATRLANQKNEIIVKKGEMPLELQEMKKKVLDTMKKITQAHAKYRKQIKERIQSVRLDSETEREIREETDVIQQEYASYVTAHKANRIPAQVGKKIFPSTSPAGNLIGGAFLPKTWVLTYDDGPHGVHTMQIMKATEAAGIPAAYFWLGQQVRQPGMKPIIEYGKARNWVLANHSMSHKNFGARGANMSALIASEIEQPTQIEKAAYGYQPNFYRCPYGACNKIMPIRQALVDRGYIHAFWAVDSLDWNKAANPNGPSDITNRVLAQMRSAGKGVILYHDIHPQSAASTQQLMPHLKKMQTQGYRFVDLCQAVDEANGDPLYTFCRYKR